MADAPAPIRVPDVEEVRAIAALSDPVIRNLRITECYARLSAAFAARAGLCANWCTFATWASRQAGRTIRGEDLLDELEREAGAGFHLLHPVKSLWRALLRRGLFRPETRLGRLVREIHSPFDAFERASDAVARGNLKVFAEIGLEFARHLAGSAPGPFSEEQDLLRRAFAHYEQQRTAAGPAARGQLVLLANLEIGYHEQMRLQPEIVEALEAVPRTAEDLAVLLPARAFRRFARGATRRAITASLMRLALPRGRTLALACHLAEPFPETLRTLDNPELAAMLGRFEPGASAPDDCGARDWSDLGQRMHFIVHLFRAFHESESLFDPPFEVHQIDLILGGRLPDGAL